MASLLRNGFGRARHSRIIQPRNLSDVLNADRVESSHAPANAAKDIGVEILVRQPFHPVFRRAFRRSRNPAEDHSE
jgi:hypothetical protein